MDMVINFDKDSNNILINSITIIKNIFTFAYC